MGTAGGPTPACRLITAAELIRHLDEAGMKRATVLSTAYILASPSKSAPHERENVAAGNGWTAARVAPFSRRIRHTCAKREVIFSATNSSGVFLSREHFSMFPRIIDLRLLHLRRPAARLALGIIQVIRDRQSPLPFFTGRKPAAPRPCARWSRRRELEPSRSRCDGKPSVRSSWQGPCRLCQ